MHHHGADTVIEAPLGGAEGDIHLSLPLEAEKTSPLKGQLPLIALDQHPILGTAHLQLHTVTGLNLKGYKIPCCRVTMVVMMVYIDLITLSEHRSRHRQTRRLIVFVLLLEALGKGHDDHAKDKNKHQGKNDWN